MKKYNEKAAFHERRALKYIFNELFEGLCFPYIAGQTVPQDCTSIYSSPEATFVIMFAR